LVPLFPYNILNYALGLTRIPLASYVTATFVCMAPGAAAYSYLGYAGGTVLTGGAGGVKAALWAVTLLGLVSLLPGFVRRRRGGETIGTRELEQELVKGGEVLVLDVRSAEEFHGPAGHVPGSVPIPVDELQSRLAELDSYRSRSLVPV
jgi:3-mercaptopyruvate sulfurtransferase SseA